MTEPQPVQTAAEAMRRAPLTAQARAAFTEGMTPEAYLARLAEQPGFKLALVFAAHWLSIRQAIWWGSLCAWKVQQPPLASEEGRALKAVVEWVLQPSEQARWATQKSREAVTSGSPVKLLAQAVFTSGGSILPPKLPVLQPYAGAAADAVAAATSVALGHCLLAEQPVHLRLFLRLAGEVAHGRNRWN